MRWYAGDRTVLAAGLAAWCAAAACLWPSPMMTAEGFALLSAPVPVSVRNHGAGPPRRQRRHRPQGTTLPTSLHGFHDTAGVTSGRRRPHDDFHWEEEEEEGDDSRPTSIARRMALRTVATAVLGGSLCGVVRAFPSRASAEVGTLPEFAGTNNVLRGLTVNVADAGQQESMVAFLENGFDMKVLRKRIRGSVEETVRVMDFVSSNVS
jgi:hypothetical protein